MPPAVFIERNNLQYNTFLQILRQHNLLGCRRFCTCNEDRRVTPKSCKLEACVTLKHCYNSSLRSLCLCAKILLVACLFVYSSRQAAMLPQVEKYRFKGYSVNIIVQSNSRLIFYLSPAATVDLLQKTQHSSLCFCFFEKPTLSSLTTSTRSLNHSLL